MKIHLAIIAGNEAGVIDRFCKSFLPEVDSLHAVLARGAREPDDTESILASHHVPCATYTNPTHPEWDHVENFAAARNQAFAMAAKDAATEDWIMWADCDDILSPAAAETLRAIRRGEGPDCEVIAIQSPYITDPSGKFAKRIRMVRVHAFAEWVNAVHEDIRLRDVPGKIAWAPDLQIVHVPLAGKTGSMQRNRRILEAIPEGDRTGREWFFLMRECEVQCDLRGAIKAGVFAAGCKDLAGPEQFAAFLTIGKYLQDPESAEPPLIEAARINPTRREPFYELAKLHMLRGSPEKAEAWLRLMEAIPTPEVPEWNHDPSIYADKWRAVDLTSAIRRTPTARKAMHKKHGLRISVCHPTCRPEKALATRELWLARAVHPEAIEYIFGIEPGVAAGDHIITRYPHAVSAPVPEGYSSAVANYNASARATTGPLIIAAQDDIYPPPAWDELLWQTAQPHLSKPVVFHVSDGHRGPGDILMVIMTFTRPWFRAQGNTLLCEEYDGYWSDTEYSHRAYKSGSVIDARHLVFYHDHPAFTGAASDEEYQRQSNPIANARGKEIFTRRNPEFFGNPTVCHLEKTNL